MLQNWTIVVYNPHILNIPFRDPFWISSSGFPSEHMTHWAIFEWNLCEVLASAVLSQCQGRQARLHDNSQMSHCNGRLKPANWPRTTIKQLHWISKFADRTYTQHKVQRIKIRTLYTTHCHHLQFPTRHQPSSCHLQHRQFIGVITVTMHFND